MLDRSLIQRIQILRRQMGMEEESYRELIRSYGVESSRDLTRVQASNIIARLGGGAEHRTAVSHFKTKYNELGVRPGFANPKQLRMLNAMWAGVSVYKTEANRDAALDIFLRNRFQLGGMKWIEGKDVQRIRRALEAMKNQKAEPQPIAEAV